MIFSVRVNWICHFIRCIYHSMLPFVALNIAKGATNRGLSSAYQSSNKFTNS